MPYANNNGVKIYYEVEGEGQPVVLHHAISFDLETWRGSELLNALLSDFRLILMDARGHGRSDKPHDPEAYTMDKRAGDVVAVLDVLNIDKSHFYGYSYGGRIGFELANFAPDRVASITVGGAGASGMTANNPGRLWMIQLYEAGREGMNALWAPYEKTGLLSPDVKARLLANDFKALLAIAKSPWPNLEDNLSNMTMPFLIIAGSSDPSFPAAQEAAGRLSDATFVPLPGLDHNQTAASPVLLGKIKEFLTRVSKK
jgi:pimeloyl-ACP methyl ester carboxylesterase